ncbi:MAG: lysylphosphatidylglycerol synthase transmembrane domain-containing protein [Candidatus Woesearchaeota archaeon]
MKWNLKNFFVGFFLILGIIATYIIIKQYGLKNIIGFYIHFNIWLLMLYFITVLIIFLILTWRWNIILLSRGHKIEFKKLFIYRLIGQSINFFTPGPRIGGEPTQAALLKKHKVEFTEGLSTIMIDKIIDSTTCGILFIIGAVLVSMHYTIPKNATIYMILGGIVFLSIIISFYYRMLSDKHFFLNIFKILQLNKIKNKTFKKIEKKIEQIELIMIQFYKHDKKIFLITIIITLLSWVAMFIEYKLATTLLGLNLGFLELFFIITFIGIAMLFPVPMAVGALEAGQISAFNMIGIVGSGGVALAFLVRIKDFIWGAIGITLLALFGFDVKKTIKRKYESKKNK